MDSFLHSAEYTVGVLLVPLNSCPPRPDTQGSTQGLFPILPLFSLPQPTIAVHFVLNDIPGPLRP